MMTNAQAALIAAASVAPNPNMISYGDNGIVVRASEFKAWLDGQDRQDAQLAESQRQVHLATKPESTGV